MYALWKDPDCSRDGFRDELLGELGSRLPVLEDIHGVRLCVADSGVEAASGRRMVGCAPLPDAVLSLWVDDAGAALRWEAFIDQCVDRKAAYLVAEAEPLINQTVHPSEPRERVFGMCQVVFLSAPAGMSQEAFLATWKDSHTRIAIATQSTFGYRQNLVVRRLDDEARQCHAIVEENFPPEAMTDDHAFYATDGDKDVLQAHMEAMMKSCVRFIDLASIDVIPMSEYLVEPLVTCE